MVLHCGGTKNYNYAFIYVIRVYLFTIIKTTV